MREDEGGGEVEGWVNLEDAAAEAEGSERQCGVRDLFRVRVRVRVRVTVRDEGEGEVRARARVRVRWLGGASDRGPDSVASDATAHAWLGSG